MVEQANNQTNFSYYRDCLSTNISQPLYKNDLPSQLWEIAEKIVMVVIYPFLWLGAEMENLWDKFSSRHITTQDNQNIDDKEINALPKSEESDSEELEVNDQNTNVNNNLPLMPLKHFDYEKLPFDLQELVVSFLPIETKCQILFVSKVMKSTFEFNTALEKNAFNWIFTYYTLQLNSNNDRFNVLLKCLEISNTNFTKLTETAQKELFNLLFTTATDAQISELLGPVIMKQCINKVFPSKKLARVFLNTLNENENYLKQSLQVPNCIDFLIPMCAICISEEKPYYSRSEYNEDFFNSIIESLVENNPKSTWWNDIKEPNNSSTFSVSGKFNLNNYVRYNDGLERIAELATPYQITNLINSNLNFEEFSKQIYFIFDYNYKKCKDPHGNRSKIPDLVFFIVSNIKDTLENEKTIKFLLKTFVDHDSIDLFIPEIMQTDLYQHVFTEILPNCYEAEGGQNKLSCILTCIESQEMAKAYIQTIQNSTLSAEAKSIYLRALTNFGGRLRSCPLEKSLLQKAFIECGLSINDYPVLEREYCDRDNNVKNILEKQLLLPYVEKILNIIKSEQLSENLRSEMDNLFENNPEEVFKEIIDLTVKIIRKQESDKQIDQEKIKEFIFSSIGYDYSAIVIRRLLISYEKIVLQNLTQLYSVPYGQATLIAILSSMSTYSGENYIQQIKDSKLSVDAQLVYLRALTHSPLLSATNSVQSYFHSFGLNVKAFKAIPDGLWNPQESIQELVETLKLSEDSVSNPEEIQNDETDVEDDWLEEEARRRQEEQIFWQNYLFAQEQANLG